LPQNTVSAMPPASVPQAVVWADRVASSSVAAEAVAQFLLP
jgi:hypothetical protein